MLNFLCRFGIHNLHPLYQEGFISGFICSRCGFKRKPGWM
jgi:hypothetical protein